MKEQYQKEMLRIHVSESLLEKTKLAMREEEKRIRDWKEKKKVLSFGGIPVAVAAAAVLLLAASGAVDYLRENPAEQTEQIYLSGQEELEIIRIDAEEKPNISAWWSELMEKIEELFR